MHHAPPVRKVPAGLQGLAMLRADAQSEARGVDGKRAGERGRGAWPCFEPTRRAKLAAWTAGGRGRGAWPGFEPTRRAKLAAWTASGRAGPTAPGTPAAQPATTRRARRPWSRNTHHSPHATSAEGADGARNTGGPANRTPAAQQQRGYTRGRRRVAASGPLHRAHLSLMRSSHVRRSPTRMPKSRFWSAMAASVAGFLMRAASTSGAAVMAPTP